MSGPVFAQSKDPGEQKEGLKTGPLLDLAGDPIPEGARARLGTVRLRVGDFMPAYAFSFDGKHLAIGTNRDFVLLLEPKTGKEIRRINLNGQGLTFLAFTPDGKRLACMGYGSGIRLFEVANGKLAAQLQHLKTKIDKEKADPVFRATGFQFSSDGQTMAVGSDTFGQQTTYIHAFDLSGRKEPQSFQVVQNYNVQVALSPDGKTLASWGHFNPRNGMVDNKNEQTRTIQLWDVETGKEHLKIMLDRFPITAATFSPDGKTLAVSSGLATYQTFDTAKGQELRRFVGRRGQVAQIRFAPDGKTIYAATVDGVVQSWETGSGKRLSLAEGPVRAPSHLAIPDQGPAMALGNQGPALHLWDAVTGKSLIPEAGHSHRINALGFKDKQIISASADGKICWWDAASGKELRHWPARDEESLRFGGPPRLANFAISLQGKYLAAGNDYGNSTIRLWDLSTGKVVCDLEGPRTINQVAPVFSPDGKYIASGGFDSMVSIWEVETGRELPPIKFKDNQGNKFGGGQVRIAFAPQGASLAISDYGYDRATGQPMAELFLWDFLANKQLGPTLKIVSGQAGTVFSPDGKFLAVPANRSVLILRADNGKEVKTLELGPSYFNVFAVTFNPDGRTLAVAVQGGNFRGETNDLIIWELASGFQRQVFRGHQGPVNCLAFSPDGQTLASGSADTTALLWDLTGYAQAPIKSPPPREDELTNWWAELAAARADHFLLYRKLLANQADTLALIKYQLKPVPKFKVDPAQIDQHIADLNNEQFAIRIKATRALEQLGEAAAPALLKARLIFDQLEPRRRIDTLLEKLERTNLNPEELRAIRAIEILEMIGSPQAQAVLSTLADGAPHARLTLDARQALARLKAKS